MLKYGIVVLLRYIMVLTLLLSCSSTENKVLQSENLHTIDLERCEYIEELKTSFFCKEAVALLLEDNEISKI
ncbi:MAG TPA: hypothetical protein PLF35_09860, partial [Prolixibacteraceae bacterium]|nr:hypothetical protein [Prolixibacteraceae bacterium]